MTNIHFFRTKLTESLIPIHFSVVCFIHILSNFGNKRVMMALDRSPGLRRKAKISHKSNGINGMRNAD